MVTFSGRCQRNERCAAERSSRSPPGNGNRLRCFNLLFFFFAFVHLLLTWLPVCLQGQKMSWASSVLPRVVFESWKTSPQNPKMLSADSKGALDVCPYPRTRCQVRCRHFGGGLGHRSLVWLLSAWLKTSKKKKKKSRKPAKKSKKPARAQFRAINLLQRETLAMRDTKFPCMNTWQRVNEWLTTP